MHRITVWIADDTFKRARIAAERPDTSASPYVEAYLEQPAATRTESERRKRQELELRILIQNFSASDRLSRDKLHDQSILCRTSWTTTPCSISSARTLSNPKSEIALWSYDEL